MQIKIYDTKSGPAASPWSGRSQLQNVNGQGKVLTLGRCTSWALGKSTALAAIPLPNRPALLTGHGSDFHAWELELHEIGTHIQLAQVQSKNSMATKLGLPRLYQQDEYHAIAVQLDGCLNKWEKSLPDDWRLQNMHMIHDRRARAERYLLHFR
jgi:hypothetical protein